MRRFPLAALLLPAVALIAATAPPARRAPPAPPVSQPAAPPNGTYTYALTRNGTDIGKTTVVVVRRDVTHTVDIDETGEASAARAHVVASYRYADASPDTYIATYRAPFVRNSVLGRAIAARPHAPFDAQTTLRYRFDDAGANATVDGSAATIALPLPGKNGKSDVKRLWVLDGPFVAGALMLPAFHHRSGETALAPVSLAFDDAAGAPLVAERLVRASPQFPKTPKNDLALDVEGVARVWYDPGNFIVHEVHFAQINVDARLLSYARTLEPATLEAAPAPTPRPRVPAIDFTFSSADGTLLSGVMNVQAGLKKLPPVVVLVPPAPSASRAFGGDGPEPMYPELALALAERGYAVMRYDTRGIAKSGGSASNETWDQALSDARALLQFAADADGVDKTHVYALGFASGADLALAAAASPEVRSAGVVALAPSVLAYRECAKRTERGAVATSAWRTSSFAHDPTALAQRTRVPLFVLHPGVAACGETADEIAAYDEKLRASNPLATILLASDLSARFGGRYDADAPVDTEAIFPYRFDASTIGAIGDWLDSPKSAAGAASGTRLPAGSGGTRANPRPPPAPSDEGDAGVAPARIATPRPTAVPSSDVLPGQVVVPGDPSASPAPAAPSATPQVPVATPTP